MIKNKYIDFNEFQTKFKGVVENYTTGNIREFALLKANSVKGPLSGNQITIYYISIVFD